MQLIVDQESPSEEYLSDFLYIDSARLAHYYAQLSAHGLVTQSKRLSKSANKEADTLGVKAVIEGTRQAESTSEESIEHHIDPTFSRPQDTLDALFEAGYINEDISTAGIGSLFLKKGRISLFDVRMLKDMWSLLGDLVASEQTKHITNTAQKHKATVEAKKQYNGIAPLIAKLPHSLQGSILDRAGNLAWFTVKPEYMLINPEDMAFKHGADLPGEWHMLGILDAKPFDSVENMIEAAAVSSDIENAMRVMLSALRSAFGRPEARFGVTPVLIFRTMKKHN